jgi:hypothetical protein
MVQAPAHHDGGPTPGAPTWLYCSIEPLDVVMCQDHVSLARPGTGSAASAKSLVTSQAIPLLFVQEDGQRSQGQGRRTAIGSHIQRVLRAQRQMNPSSGGNHFVEERPWADTMEPTQFPSNEESQAQQDHNQPHANPMGFADLTLDSDAFVMAEALVGTTGFFETASIRSEHAELSCLRLTTQTEHTRKTSTTSSTKSTRSTRQSGKPAAAQAFSWRLQSRSASSSPKSDACTSSDDALVLPDSILPPSLPVHDSTGLVSTDEAWAMLNRCT